MSIPPQANAFLRWAGSKRKLLPRLQSRLPSQFNRYIEPFAGSACLFFAINPSKAVLGDINQDLIHAYTEVRDRPSKLATELRKMPKGEKSYYQLRKLDPLSLSRVKRAARFIYLNRFCFNGLYRTNNSGEFNVPYGGERSGQIPTLEILKNCAAALQSADLVNGSFDVTLELVRTGDFVYLDPPYSIKSRRVFNEYSNAIFGPEQLKRLRSQLKRLDKLGVPFLVSYGHSREALELAKGFRSEQTMVQRQIAGFVTDRRTARELLITNY